MLLSNLLLLLAQVLSIGLTILYWLILIRAVISWVNPDPDNPIIQFLYRTTEPILYPIRRILPLGLRFGIDISPIIAFFAIILIKSFLIRTLISISAQLG